MESLALKYESFFNLIFISCVLVRQSCIIFGPSTQVLPGLACVLQRACSQTLSSAGPTASYTGKLRVAAVQERKFGGGVCVFDPPLCNILRFQSVLSI